MAVGVRSRVPYESRWAPYVRAHEPGQGQLPSGSIRPRGYDSVAPRSPAGGNLVTQAACRHHAGDGFSRTINAMLPRRSTSGLTYRLGLGAHVIGRARAIKPPCDPFDALGG